MIYSSDLGRALQIAEQISNKTGVEIITDIRLRERNLGVFQGLTKSEMQQRLPEEFTKYRVRDPEHAIPGGESPNQKFEEVVECINEISEKHPGQTIVVVTHGGVLNGIFRYVVGLPLDAPRRFKLWNTGINTFSCKNGKWKLLSFGETTHLDSLKTMDDE